MKSVLLSIFLFSLFIISGASFANKITITGQPIILEQKDGLYYLPTAYKEDNLGYHYVTIGDANRVCYLEKNPALNDTDLMRIRVQVNNSPVEWNCYLYDPQYFEIQ